MAGISHRQRSACALALALSLPLSHQALAVGFMVNAPSQVTGLANAGSTVYDRSTAAISNNPAAMSLLEGEQIVGIEYRATGQKDTSTMQAFGNEIILNASIPSRLNFSLPAGNGLKPTS